MVSSSTRPFHSMTPVPTNQNERLSVEREKGLSVKATNTSIWFRASNLPHPLETRGSPLLYATKTTALVNTMDEPTLLLQSGLHSKSLFTVKASAKAASPSSGGARWHAIAGKKHNRTRLVRHADTGRRTPWVSSPSIHSRSNGVP